MINVSPDTEGTASASRLMASVRLPFRFVIAPNLRQARLFVEDSRHDYGWEWWQVRVATDWWHLRGMDFRNWEVWWLGGMWPCRTRRDVENMEEMMAYARARGAKIRRWWT